MMYECVCVCLCVCACVCAVCCVCVCMCMLCVCVLVCVRKCGCCVCVSACVCCECVCVLVTGREGHYTIVRHLFTRSCSLWRASTSPSPLRMISSMSYTRITRSDEFTRKLLYKRSNCNHKRKTSYHHVVCALMPWGHAQYMGYGWHVLYGL